MQKRQSGVGRSIAGRVLKHFVRDDGEAVTLPNDAPATIEFEIAYILGRDVAPDDASLTSPIEAVAAIHPAFEIVLSRFIDRRAVGWPSFAADNGAFQALVLGHAIDRHSTGTLASDVVVSVDGEEAARRLSGEDATDPVAALTDLIAIARERGMMLPKGSIVSTGTVTKPFNVTGVGRQIAARFLGRTLAFTTDIGNSNSRGGK